MRNNQRTCKVSRVFPVVTSQHRSWPITGCALDDLGLLVLLPWS
jgi:hypothetical protein